MDVQKRRNKERLVYLLAVILMIIRVDFWWWGGRNAAGPVRLDQCAHALSVWHLGGWFCPGPLYR